MAQRFELYVDGVELANGYQELTDPDEQLQRFERENRLRKARGQDPIAIDTNLVEALRAGMPECSGVALGVDPGNPDLDNLRYHKICILADADSDGLHIATLLCALFLHHYRDLVLAGHVYVAMPPLYRIDRGKETAWAWDDAEKDRIVADGKGGSKPSDITRFKGLGEISPGEFKHFISPKMRLTPVRVDNRHSIPAILSFYMGRNTPERRNYIMNHLVVETAP
mgnify:CR=1 FL=1